MKIIIFGFLVFATVAAVITGYYGLGKLAVSLGFIGFAIILYLLNLLLIQYFIKKGRPDLRFNQETFPGIQKWEITEGVGIMPKWVTSIGLLSISALIAAFVPPLVALIE